MLSVNSLTIYYENLRALDVKLISHNGREAVAIIGVNGAGKTTFSYCISGFIHEIKFKLMRERALNVKISGAVSYNDKNITLLRPHQLRKMGLLLVPERTHAIFPELSVKDNIMIGLVGSNIKSYDSRLNDVLSLFPVLKQRFTNKAGYLSGGEQQMVTLARALMGSPSILVVDEPLLGLSPIIQNEVITTLKTINKQGIGLLILEQYGRKLLNLCDRFYLLERGVNTESFTADKVKDIMYAYI